MLVPVTVFAQVQEGYEPSYPECDYVDFTIIIDVGVYENDNYSLVAQYNEYENAKTIEQILLSSDNPLEVIENIRCQMAEPKAEAYEKIDAVQETNRWNPDGTETDEYIFAWTEYRAYNDVIGFIGEIGELTRGGMSLETALSQVVNRLQIHPEMPHPESEPETPNDPRDELGDEIEELNNKISELEIEIAELVRQNESLKDENESLERRLNEVIQNQIEEEQKSMRKEIASFVDSDKDPQSYIDRYDNEETYREWFHDNYPDYKSIHEAVGKREPVPDWIRTNAQWWSEGLISEDDFVKGIEYLVKQKIIDVN